MRDPENGELLLDENNEPQLDADFTAVSEDFLRSPAAAAFQWAMQDKTMPPGPQSWSVDMDTVVRGPYLNLDPKRNSYKFNHLWKQIRSGMFIKLGDILQAVKAVRPGIKPSGTYDYVEIEKVGFGDYDCVSSRGWELPQRARLRAKAGDLFIAHLWSSAGKWFVAAGDTTNLLVTNGFAHFRFLEGMEDYLPDIAVGLSSEAFRVQLRALSTGSDGLAEISDLDMAEIILPVIDDPALREKIKDGLVHVLAGRSSFAKDVRQAISNWKNFPTPPPRKSHCALV